MLSPNYKIVIKNQSDNTSDFIIEPLPQSFGHTLGNALRRTLLSSLSGSAPIRVKIDGVSHQFSAHPGIQEDILDFILNLKELNFAIDTDETEIDIRLSASGKKTVMASDLELPAGVRLANPELILATLTSPKSKLNATITIGSGLGYVSSEEHMTDEVGVIPLDSSFSPVVEASYSVEAARVGRKSNYDKIRLHVVTDGSITPEEAFKKSAQILQDYYTHINGTEAYEKAETPVEVAVASGLIDDLDLPTRTLNALKKANLFKLSDLASMTLSDLKKVKSLGDKSVADILEKAGEKGVVIS
jgi:DNA-directed RNA polymerase subunit alpha